MNKRLTFHLIGNVLRLAGALAEIHQHDIAQTVDLLDRLQLLTLEDI